MADDEKKPSALGPLSPLGLGVGGSAIGLGLGLTLGNGQLPTKTFEWVLDKGVSGLLLVLVFILGVLFLREKDAREREQDERLADTRNMMKDNAETLAKVAVALDQAKAALLRSDETLRSLTEKGHSP
jgi:hypothetical protein